MRLMADLDGVFGDFDNAFFAKHEEIYDRKISLEARSNRSEYVFWNAEDLGITQEEFQHVFDSIDWANLPLTIDFDEYYEYVKKARFVRIITSRPSYLYDQTADWLKKNNFRYEEIHFVSEKWKYCGDLTHILEDHQDTMERIKEEHPDIIVIPVPRLWNKM